MKNFVVLNVIGKYSNNVCDSHCNKDNMDRWFTSLYLFSVKSNNQTVGFVSLIEEKYNKSFLFLDIEILSKFRGNNLCNDVCLYVNNLGIKEFIVVK